MTVWPDNLDGQSRDRVYWLSGLLNGVMMTAYGIVVYRAIRKAIEDRREERRYIEDLRRAGTPFGPVGKMRLIDGMPHYDQLPRAR